MKWTIVAVFAGLLATTLSSCDSSDPVVSPDTQETSAIATLDKANCQGEIALDAGITLHSSAPSPSSTSESAYINGKVAYGVSPSPILVRDMLSVSLNLNAVVESNDGTDRTWIFTGNSTDQIASSVADPNLFVKEYKAPGTSAGSDLVTLYVRYEVTGCRVSVHSMWAVEGGLRTSAK